MDVGGHRSQRSKTSTLSDLLSCSPPHCLLLLYVYVYDVGGHIYSCVGIGGQHCRVSSCSLRLRGILARVLYGSHTLTPGHKACTTKHL